MHYGNCQISETMEAESGLENGHCHRPTCGRKPARWFNHADQKWYCGECAHYISDDYETRDWWMTNFWPTLGHPMFEMRMDMERRTGNRKDSVSFPPRERVEPEKDENVSSSRFIRRYGRHRKDRYRSTS